MKRLQLFIMLLLLPLVVAVASAQQPSAPNFPASQHPPQQGAIETPAPELLTDVDKRTPIELKTFEQYALAANPTLRQAQALVNRSAGQARQAGLWPNPMVGYQGEQIRGGSYNGGEEGGFVQETFPLGGKLGLRRNVFQQQTKEDQIEAEEQRYRVLSDVDQQYYIALAAQEIVNIRHRLLGISNDARETAYRLANVGQADTPDVLQSEVESEQAVLDYTTAERTFIHEFRSLAALVGKPDLPLAPLAGNLEDRPKVDSDHVAEQITQNSPSVKRAKQDVIRSEAELKSAKRESVPDLQIHAGLQNNFEPLTGFTNRAVGIQGFVTAGISIPIFNRNPGNVDAARADLERAQSEVGRVQLSLQQAVQPVLQGYLSAEAQANRYKNEMIPRASHAYELYLAKYRQMAAAYPEVIVSQRTLFQLQVAYVEVLRDVWSNAVVLRNFLLSGGLEAPQPSSSMDSTLNLPSAGGGAQ